MKPFSFLKTLCSNAVQVFRRTPPLVFAMSILSIGGFIGFTSATKILVSGLKPAEDTITVTGASTERIESDMAKWDIKVQTKGSSQIDSYQNHTKSMQKTINFLDSNGVKTNDYQTRELGPATTSKKVTKNTKTGEIISTHWLTSQWIEIESTDVANINKTHRKISELLGKGVLVKPNSPKFTYTKLPGKRIDMLAKATKDARIRAEAIVRETGAELGSVKKVNTGVFQITVPNSTRVSSWGSYDTSTIKKDITAVMGVTFAVK